jgi:hypothetical protein
MSNVLAEPSRQRTDSERDAAIAGPLAEVNEHFHACYEATRSLAEERGPVLILLAESLVLHSPAGRRALAVRPRSYEVIKAVTHAPVGLFALLESPRPAAGALANAITRTQAALVELDSPYAQAHSERTRRDLEQVLQQTLHVATAVRDGAADRDARHALARALGPALLRLVRDAGQLALDALHAAVEALMAKLSAAERARLHVVVTGDHQARERSLGLQYFQRRLCEPRDCEQRVTYAEAVQDEQAALALVGTQRLDRALAQAFFGDARRLQRDVLGDAAHALLEASHFAPIDGR